MKKILKEYPPFDGSRYSSPWVYPVASGRFDLRSCVGGFDGDAAKGGALFVNDPAISQVYAYGQKDHAGGNTEVNFAKWTASGFLPCDKSGCLTKGAWIC